MKTKFELIQLSKPKCVKLQPIGSDIFSFEAKVEMEQDRFDALFKYCRGNWNEKKYAEIEHEGFYQRGEPINPIFRGLY